MISDESTQNNIGKELTAESEKLFLKDIGSYMESLEKAVADLQAATKILPKVDEKGNSECPFAESLYAKKEKAYETVVEKLKNASGYLDLVKQEINMWQQNLNQINSDANDLNLPQVGEEYNRAREAANIQIERNLMLQQELTDLISKAEEHLQLAQKKSWPLGKPKEDAGQMPVFDRVMHNAGHTEFKSQASVAPMVQRPELNTEIDSLLSLGPLN